MTLEELRRKDVIQAVSGENLGRIDDLRADPTIGQITALILHGRPKLFGLLGRGPDLEIPWEKVKCIGTDVVMTTVEIGAEYSPRRKWILF